MLQLNGDGLITCHVCSIPHDQVILVKRLYLGGIPSLPDYNGKMFLKFLLIIIIKIKNIDNKLCFTYTYV
jgi:hypothetical protein